jgi:hypothetical protein
VNPIYPHHKPTAPKQANYNPQSISSCPFSAFCRLSGVGLVFLTGGLRICGVRSGLSDCAGGNTLVSETSWLEAGLTPSCFSGAGIGSGRTCAGICDGEGAMRIGAGAGEDMCCGKGAGELCFVGEKEGRCAELGGNEECGLLKL